MNLEFFLKCEHDIEINTSMTRLYCTKCGQDKNVIDYITDLKAMIKESIPWVKGLDKPSGNVWVNWINKAEKIK